MNNLNLNNFFLTHITTKAKVISPDASMTAKASEAAQKFGITDVRQPDLVYLEDILVSTGINLNDDEFLAEELIKAVIDRNTVPLKPVNWEHKPKEVIGVMYDSDIYDRDGNKVSLESLADIKEFDVVDKSVLWPVVDYEKVQSVVDGAEDGTKFVSMECYFSDYDYRVGSKLVKRTEQTAFFDDYLRVKGGEGIFRGERVSRVLRNIVFGGKGIVDQPANPGSKIRSVANINEEQTMTQEEIDALVAKVKELEDASESTKKVVEALELEKVESASRLEELTKTLEESSKKADELSKENEALRVQITEKDSSKAEVEGEKKNLEDQIAQMQKDLEIVQGENATMKAELSELKKTREAEAVAKKLSERESALAAILGEEDAKTSLEIYKDMSDEGFAKQVELMTKAFEKGKSKDESVEDDAYEVIRKIAKEKNITLGEDFGVNSNSHKENFAAAFGINRKK